MPQMPPLTQQVKRGLSLGAKGSEVGEGNRRRRVLDGEQGFIVGAKHLLWEVGYGAS